MDKGDYRQSLLRETRDELARADAKASILLAASGIAFAALLSAGSTSSWYPDKLSHQGARVLAWIAVALVLLGIGVVGAAVKPRLRANPSEQSKPYYFGDVEAYWPRWWQLGHRGSLRQKGRDDFAKALQALSSSAPEQSERLDEQIWTLSHIAYRKYRLVSIGMWLYAGSALAAVTALAVEKAWL
jgi:hypothetical protein